MRDDRLKYLFVLPAVAVVFATAVWPLAESLRLSFTVGRLNRPGFPQGYLGLENYLWAFFEEPAFWNSVRVTALYTFATVSLTTLIALGLALLLAPGGRLRGGVQTLLILPFAMSPALIGVSFRFMFNPEFGLFDAFFGFLLPPLAEVSWLADPALAFSVCVMADVWGWIPFLTLVLIGGLAAVPRETLEAAAVDGASGWRVFKDITLPQLVPVLGVVVILKSVFSLKTFDQVYMLTNGGPGTATQTLSHYVYFNGLKYGQLGYSAAVAWLMVVPMIALTWLYARYVFRGSRPDS
ncbi:MAG: sugar ABC transporter permease [Alphaproteobacteria bacterium]|nr:sugar ABC transporter permease [Alphaproteobacteria bacterium]MDA8001546.1 sugar ABC transporter permease [Alphaproteobacteria bacterium]MDA8004498.1 sugar ABC transporter permease [Alphaproteobacteria bacterium]MDA8006363.1 sugar ABC transporter permease [Alphaproteobacteria bacterium]MDA8009476.1 sugar ABC transporter permease [Alphaproteobacteria bacterium]